MEERKIVYPEEKNDIQVITPEQAKEFLKYNHNNRNLRNKDVKQLVEHIKNEKFYRVGDCIVFDIYGNLIGGQHRLTAIAESGIPVKVDIKYGADPMAKYYMDTGRHTTLNDKGTRFLKEYDVEPFMFAPICIAINYINDNLFERKLNEDTIRVEKFTKDFLPLIQKIANKRKIYQGKKEKNNFKNKTVALGFEIIASIINEDKASLIFDNVYATNTLLGTIEHTILHFFNNENEILGKKGEDKAYMALCVGFECACKNKYLSPSKFKKDVYKKLKDEKNKTKIYDTKKVLEQYKGIY